MLNQSINQSINQSHSCESGNIFQVSVRVKIDGCCGILNVDLTCTFCYDFEFSCLVLQWRGVWLWASLKLLKK